jgi:PD-(D/E)XK nuclease family transposase
MRFADIRNDIAFRKIFGNEKKTVSLVSFLNAALKLEGSKRVVKAKVMDANLFPRIAGEKASVIDVSATDQRGRKFIVEMQVADKDGFDKRVQYYTSKDYSMQIEQGDDYIKLNPTYFIKNAKKLDVIPDNTDDDGLKEAYIDAEKHKWTKSELVAYDKAFMRQQDAIGELSHAKKEGKEEGLKEGKEEGLKEGLQQGEERKETEAVIGLYGIGITSENIAKGLKITVEKVLEIIDKHQK